MPCSEHRGSPKSDRLVVDNRPGHHPAYYCGATTDKKTTCTKRVWGIPSKQTPGVIYKENPITQAILDSLGVDDAPNHHGVYPTSPSPLAMYSYELETSDTEGDSN